jgi:hypothetical protein
VWGTKLKSGKAPKHGIWLYFFNNKQCLNKPDSGDESITDSSEPKQHREDVSPSDAEELHRRCNRIRIEISLRSMTNTFTPDEDAILGEILGTNNFDISGERIKELSVRCNMTHERTLKAISSLYKKSALNLPE